MTTCIRPVLLSGAPQDDESDRDKAAGQFAALLAGRGDQAEDIPTLFTDTYGG